MGRLVLAMASSFDDVDRFFEHLSAVEAQSDESAKAVLSILKATSFLVLYNVAEAATRLCVEAIAEAIERAGLPLGCVSEHITALMIREELFKPLRDGARIATGEQLAMRLMLRAAGQATLVVPTESLPIGGNVDARKIRQLAERFGFTVNPPPEAKGGNCLETIKSRRNNLAHGSETFTACGNDYVVDDLRKFKDEFELYLKAVLSGVEDYLQERKYDLGVVLGRVEQLGEGDRMALLERFGSPLAVFSADSAELEQVSGVTKTIAARIVVLGRAVRLS